MCIISFNCLVFAQALSKYYTVIKVRDWCNLLEAITIRGGYTNVVRGVKGENVSAFQGQIDIGVFAAPLKMFCNYWGTTCCLICGCHGAPTQLGLSSVQSTYGRAIRRKFPWCFEAMFMQSL